MIPQLDNIIASNRWLQSDDMDMDEKYPQYGFKKHKGYPTKEHYALLNAYIDEHGDVPAIYRRSFLKNLHRE